MKYIISFIINFVIIYIFHILTVVLRKSKYEKYKKSKEVSLFVKKYHLDFNKISIGKFLNILSLVNSFIMSLAILSVYFVPNLILKMLVTFVLLIILILIFYTLLGKYIERVNKNV